MSIPLSAIGISKEDQILMSERLFPEANRIFLERVAKRLGANPEHIHKLDYANHPLYIQQVMMERRQMKYDMLKDRDTSEFDYPYKTIEEAKATDGDGKHIQLDEPESLDDIEKKFPKYWKAKEIEKIKKKIEKFKIDYDLESISEEDEKSPHIV